MTFDQIIQNLKKGQYSPIYLLMGDEPYFIDVITDYIVKNALSEEEKGFNQTILYGKDLDPTNIIHAARQYPMGAQRQVIVVKEAQNIRDIEKLAIYAEAPMPSTILVINYKYKTLDKRKKLAKLANKTGVLYESKKLYDNQVPTWIGHFIKGKGLTMETKAGVLLTEFLGSNLSKIAHEIEKLQIALGPEVKHITSEHIEHNIGVSKDYNNFELQKAILTKDVIKANKIILAFGKNNKDHPIQVTIATLFNYFQKLLAYYYLPDKSKQSVASALKINPFFVSDYQTGAKYYPARKVVQVISLLREFDMKSKGYKTAAIDNGELLKEMIFKIMH
ncbi:DNA polymerase III subunit delta [Marinilabiliaceae bacterium JC017]|nr:DNA polymerase III subunit delta [Marinilabiliaceae bacterium JC017]